MIFDVSCLLMIMMSSTDESCVLCVTDLEDIEKEMPGFITVSIPSSTRSMAWYFKQLL